MKKITYFLVAIVLMVSFVNAEDNKLSFFSSEDGSFFYRTNLDNNQFIVHKDLIPGKKYVDELKIENLTDDSYKLFMSVNIYDQNELVRELVDNISVKVYFDDRIIYDGLLTGLKYLRDEVGVNASDMIYIGIYDSNSYTNLRVETKLLESYSNIYNRSTVNYDWNFYVASTTINPGDDPDPGENPNPGGDPDPGQNPDSGGDFDPGQNPDSGGNQSSGDNNEENKDNGLIPLNPYTGGGYYWRNILISLVSLLFVVVIFLKFFKKEDER